MRTDKRMEELLDDPVANELYGLFLKVKDSPRHIFINAETLLNEVNYIYTEFCRDKRPAEHIDRFEHEIEVDLGWHYATNLVMPMAYAAMRLKPAKSKKLQTLLSAIEKQYGGNDYWETFAGASLGSSRRTGRTSSTINLPIDKNTSIIIRGNASINLYSSGNIIGKNISYEKGQ